MLIRVGPQLKPISSYRHVRWKRGAPDYFLIADQGGRFIDASDSRHVVTNTGGVTAGAGPRGPILNYNGTSGYQQLGAIYQSFFNLTISVDFVISSTGGSNRALYDSRSATSSYSTFAATGFVLFVNTSTNALSLFDRQANQQYDSSTVVTDGKLHTATLSYELGVSGLNAVGFVLYLDGNQIQTASFNTQLGSAAHTSAFWSIGAAVGPSALWPGGICAFRIYPRPMGAAEALAEHLDPWWRLRRKRPWWMGTAAAGAVLWPGWYLDNDLCGGFSDLGLGAA